jgi:hypothetical protein
MTVMVVAALFPAVRLSEAGDKKRLKFAPGRLMV